MAKKTAELTPLPRGAEVLHAFSRFSKQDLFFDQNTKFWGTWDPVNVLPSPADNYYTVTAPFEGRLDLISYRYYNTPELWWVLAEVNGLFFVPEDVVVGLILRIPSYTTLATLGIIR